MVYETNIRVRFSDTDMYGHVNNSRYATYMEEIRIQFIQDVFGEFSLPLILASASYQYVRQTRFPEHRDIRAKMWFTRIGNSSAEIRTHLLSDNGDLLCDSKATVVHFDYKSQKAARLPNGMRAVMEKYLHEAESVPYAEEQ